MVLQSRIIDKVGNRGEVYSFEFSFQLGDRSGIFFGVYLSENGVFKTDVFLLVGGYFLDEVVHVGHLS